MQIWNAHVYINVVNFTIDAFVNAIDVGFCVLQIGVAVCQNRSNVRPDVQHLFGRVRPIAHPVAMPGGFVLVFRELAQPHLGGLTVELSGARRCMSLALYFACGRSSDLLGDACTSLCRYRKTGRKNPLSESSIRLATV